jgi:hypothetical protein
VASFLRDEAFDWFQAAVVQTNREFTVYEEFTTLFKSVFGEDVSVHQDKAFASLRSLRQTHSAQNYATKFTQIAAKVTIDEFSKIQLFKEGLKPAIKLHLIGLTPTPKTLQEIMDAVIRYDDDLHLLNGPSGVGRNHNFNNYNNRRGQFNHAHRSTSNPSYHAGTSGNNSTSTTSSTSEAVPMDLDAVDVKTTRDKLSLNEKARRREQGLCVYCGSNNCGGNKDVNKCALLIKKNQGKGPGPGKA